MQEEPTSRLNRLESRMTRLQSLWANDQAYAQIVASGRFIKLCAATGETADAVDRALAEADEAGRQPNESAPGDRVRSG